MLALAGFAAGVCVGLLIAGVIALLMPKPKLWPSTVEPYDENAGIPCG